MVQDREAIQPHITFLGGYQAGESIWLDKSEITFGREMDNAVVFNDDSAVSRYHARIVLADDGYWLEDLGSSNGTFVNGQRLESAVLLGNGDQFKIGTTVMSVNLPHQVRAAAPVGPAAPMDNRRMVIMAAVAVAILLLGIVVVIALGGS